MYSYRSRYVGLFNTALALLLAVQGIAACAPPTVKPTLPPTATDSPTVPTATATLDDFINPTDTSTPFPPTSTFTATLEPTDTPTLLPSDTPTPTVEPYPTLQVEGTPLEYLVDSVLILRNGEVITPSIEKVYFENIIPKNCSNDYYLSYKIPSRESFEKVHIQTESINPKDKLMLKRLKEVQEGYKLQAGERWFQEGEVSEQLYSQRGNLEAELQVIDSYIIEFVTVIPGEVPWLDQAEVYQILKISFILDN